MASRVPTIADLAALSRDDWDSLCAGICSLFYQVQRVEDRRGRGNGLDGWRITPRGIEGFQHRRLNARFGESQVRALKDNIELAVQRCRTEMRGSLVKYHVLLNIDLEPGHMGAKGEIERWHDLGIWTSTEYGVELVLHSATWVLSRLQRYPKLRPDLFEDIAGAIVDAQEKITNKIDSSIETLAERLEELLKASKLNDKLKNVLAGLAREARTHFQRGVDHEVQEEYQLAIVKLQDARRLLVLENVDQALLGHVLLFLCGVQTIVGHLKEALADGEKAIEILKDSSHQDLLRFARGNVAFALLMLQRYAEARPLFEGLLVEYEADADLTELVRTIQHLTELSCNARDTTSAMIWVERLKVAVRSLVEIRGEYDKLTIGALGTEANVLTTLARNLPDPISQPMLRRACELLTTVEEVAPSVGSPLQGARALGAKAQALWFLNQLEAASDLYAKAVTESDRLGLEKLAADALFNRGLIRLEQKRSEEGRALIFDARRRYVVLGDGPSIEDVDRILHP